MPHGDQRRDPGPRDGRSPGPFVLGLTGSIGMGKSATAGLFREAGVPVHDADACVHALYAPGGAAVGPVGALFPGVVDAAGGVDRVRLRAAVLGDDGALKRLEAAVHPLVRAAEADFLAGVTAPLAVLDVPLLYETGGERRCDAVAVVTAPEAVQRARVLARPGMTEATLDAILTKQVPDAEKRRRADFLIDTGGGFPEARRQVEAIVAAIGGGWARGARDRTP